jgi:hypothetical protein
MVAFRRQFVTVAAFRRRSVTVPMFTLMIPQLAL